MLLLVALMSVLTVLAVDDEHAHRWYRRSPTSLAVEVGSGGTVRRAQISSQGETGRPADSKTYNAKIRFDQEADNQFDSQEIWDCVDQERGGVEFIADIPAGRTAGAANASQGSPYPSHAIKLIAPDVTATGSHSDTDLVQSGDDLSRYCLVDSPIANLLKETSSDDVVEWKKIAAQADGENPLSTDASTKRRIAFVVLVGSTWPMESIWADWLAGVDPDLFQFVIYTYNGVYRPRSAIFKNSMMGGVATKRCNLSPAMLAGARTALESKSVAQVVTMCESTIPLKPFNVVYDSLAQESQSKMCTWKNRGMPFSYVWTRSDASLLSEHESALRKFFNHVHVCDAEDVFVVPLKLASRNFTNSCVTWNGWNQKKGFYIGTNGVWYNRLKGDPLSRYKPSTPGHPAEVQRIAAHTLKGMINDRTFLFARKFYRNSTVAEKDTGIETDLAAYLKESLTAPSPDSS